MCIRDRLQELILPESVQSIAEFNGVVCVGLHREYSILSLVDGDARSLLPIPPTLRQTQYQRLQNLLATEIQQLSLIHISEPTRLLSISYAVFCLKKKKKEKKK
eukprot:TRINITY_DN62881_c0_g1_i1.p2 TRINITY_DN62881_c0_g1~~TRINITY_DN62881_c0_g1_i1.p2  ORF type:complete len:104 (+),score=35.94 TRINITY_DN62881_c0_g1_i1:145-456(+)